MDKKELENYERRFEELDKAQKEESLKLAETYINNVKKYGYPTWYEWAYENSEYKAPSSISTIVAGITI